MNNVYGGMGGIPGGREIDSSDEFEILIKTLFGDQIKDDDSFASEIWSALTNVMWVNTNGDVARYSFRAAGDLVAAVRGSGDYMDWYCSGPSGVVSDAIRDSLARHNWATQELEDRPGNLWESFGLHLSK